MVNVLIEFMHAKLMFRLLFNLLSAAFNILVACSDVHALHNTNATCIVVRFLCRYYDDICLQKSLEVTGIAGFTCAQVMSIRCSMH